MIKFKSTLGSITKNPVMCSPVLVDCDSMLTLPRRHIFDRPFDIGLCSNFEFPLYKLTRKVFADQFFDKGRLRLGTFLDFAKEDVHGSIIGDFNEGLLTSNFVHMGVEITYGLTSVNSFVYSTSQTCSNDLMMEFNADAVIQINSVDFFSEITRVIQETVKTGVITAVDYYEKSDWEREIVKNIDFSRTPPKFVFDSNM
jgi:hypothetical protein